MRAIELRDATARKLEIGSVDSQLFCFVLPK